MIRHVTLAEQERNCAPIIRVKLSPDQSSFRPDSRNPLSSFIFARCSFHERKIYACVKDKRLGLLRIEIAESVHSLHHFTFSALRALY